MAPGDRASRRVLHRYLLDDEQVVVVTRHHWARLAEPVTTAVGAFLLVAWASEPVRALVGEAALLLWWGWFAVLGRLAWKVLEWRNEWFVATDRRLLLTYGLLTHKVAMMPLRKVTDMNYARSPMGRVLGYGQFLLESAGQDQAMREIDWLPDPDRAYRRICDTIFGPGVRDPDDALREEPERGAAPDVSPWAADPPWEADAPEWPGTPAGAPDEPDTVPAGEPGGYRAPDLGWEVSTEDADQYVEVRLPPRPRRRPAVEEVAPVEDPDATGPIPRPGRVRPGPRGSA